MHYFIILTKNKTFSYIFTTKTARILPKKGAQHSAHPLLSNFYE